MPKPPSARRIGTGLSGLTRIHIDLRTVTTYTVGHANARDLMTTVQYYQPCSRERGILGAYCRVSADLVNLIPVGGAGSLVLTAKRPTRSVSRMSTDLALCRWDRDGFLAASINMRRRAHLRHLSCVSGPSISELPLWKKINSSDPAGGMTLSRIEEAEEISVDSSVRPGSLRRSAVTRGSCGCWHGGQDRIGVCPANSYSWRNPLP